MNFFKRKKQVLLSLIILFFTVPCFAIQTISFKRTPLDFDWELYIEKDPLEVINASEHGLKPDTMIAVPSYWDKTIREVTGNKSPYTYACYRTVVKDLTPGMEYGISIREAPLSALAIYVNGEIITQNGDPFYKISHPEETAAQQDHHAKSQLRPINGQFYCNEKGEAEIVILLTNYFYRKGGLYNSVSIGPAKNITNLFTLFITYNCFVAGILFFFGILNFIIFLINRKRIESIYLSITAICFGIRVLTAGFCALGFMWPHLGGHLKVKLEFLAMWVCPIAVMELYNVMFLAKKENLKNKKLNAKNIRFFISIPAAIFGVLTLVLPARLANKLVPELQVFLVLFIVYYLVVIIGALKEKRKYIGYYFASILTLIFGFFGDLIYTIFGTLPVSTFPFFMMWFVIIEIILQAKYQKDIFDDTVMVSGDLKQINETLFRYVPKETLKMLNREDVQNARIGDYSKVEMCLIYCELDVESTDGKEITQERYFKYFNDFLKMSSKIIKSNNGFVNKVVSGGFIALYPALITSGNESVKTAFEIDDAVSVYNNENKNEGIKLIPRMGIHHGKMTIATVGEIDSMDDVIISDCVDTASRMVDVCKTLNTRIIISQSIRMKLDIDYFDSIYLRELRALQVKGKEKLLQLYNCSRFEGGSR